MLAAGLSFGGMGVLVKLGGARFSSDELVFYRSLIGLLIVLALLYGRGQRLATPFWQGHLWRGLSGTIAMMLFFYCIVHLPLSTAITLNYTSGLFLAALTVLALGDRFHLPLTGILLLGFSGIALVLHPTLEREQIAIALLGLLSGALAGIALLNVRLLGEQGESASRIVFYFSLISTLLSGLWMMRGELHPLTWHDLSLLIGIGGTATFAQLAMTRAHRSGTTLVVSTLSYSTIVFAALFDLLLWNEALTLSGWLGMALIISSGVLALKLSPKH
ncbi:MAG: DMT family transporter [Nitrosomonadales bacterium]|nr:DMT family transporter [Nitrosomonadales bacterium]